MDRNLEVVAATTHNLKSVSVAIPRNQLVVVTGVSGSGKSSLVFDTIYTESQRQLIETFSAFARKLLPRLSRPPVEEIRNLGTAIVIDQKRLGRNSRSTVGTATELITYLRLLYSRVGSPFIGPSFYFSFNHPEGMCPECQGLGRRVDVDVDRLLDPSKSLREGAIVHPDHTVGSWAWRELVGSNLFDNDTPLCRWSEADRDRLLYSEPVPIERRHGAGVYMKKWEGIARKMLRVHVGKGEIQTGQYKSTVFDSYFVDSDCSACHGSRINERAQSVRIDGVSMADLTSAELTDVDQFLAGVDAETAVPLVTKMRRLLSHLIEIGVGYLSLNRPVATLSGGESQRVKMARQLDCDLVGLLYILDEPSIGLHARDTEKLVSLLRNLADRGNSVLVVEHDPDVIRSADWVTEIGPGAGTDGGMVTWNGPRAEFESADTITASLLGRQREVTREPRTWSDAYSVRNATIHNLHDVSVDIPKGVLTCVTGVAGSGKSSLIHDVFCRQHPEAIVVDQSPLGRSSRSNPATYIGAFTQIRKEFASACDADPSLFSFNSKGACPVCKGLGYVSVEMHFLDDIRKSCDECGGRRYREEVLALSYRGKSINDVLNMPIVDAACFFSSREVRRKLDVLCDVGVGYLELGQPLSTLSGGECQRVKLASELHKSGNLYVMDEPTTGLHMADIDRLLEIIDRLVGRGNTVIVIEHNLDVIGAADWVIDLGPGGGRDGGRIVATGTPDQVAVCDESHTGRFLQQRLAHR